MYYNSSNSCATLQQFKDNVYEISANFFVVNENLDPNNLDDPISTTSDDQYAINIDPSFYTTYDILIQKNEYEIDKGYVLEDISKGNLYQVAGSTHKIARSHNDHTFFYGTIMISPESKIYKSQTYKLLDAIGTIGGVYELAFGVLYFIYSFFSTKIYFYHMVSSLKRAEGGDGTTHKRETKYTENSNNQNTSRVQQSSQNVYRHNRYASMARVINDARQKFKLLQRQKMQKIKNGK